MDMEIGIFPNKKTRIEYIEISCYGKELIMVDHPQITPIPLAPGRPLEHEYAEGTGHPEFWEREPIKRTEMVIEALDKRLNWEEYLHELAFGIGEDIDKAREEIEQAV